MNTSISVHTKERLNFLNSILLPAEFTVIEQVNNHDSQSMNGWDGIESFIGKTTNNELYDVDIRYAWGIEIFRQDLYDYNITEACLPFQQPECKSNRHKLIVYFGNFSNNSTQLNILPAHFVVGNKWQTIHHCYMSVSKFYLPNLFQFCHEKTSNLGSYISSSINLTSSSPLEHYSKGGLRTQGVLKTSIADKTLVSIIIVVFNGEQYLEQAVQSVINQSYQNIELIIVDAVSQDRTLEIVRKYENFIDYWISEPDQGIYDAMNKAISIIRGDWIFFLGSDDCLFDSRIIESAMKNQGNVSLIYGDVVCSNNSYIKPQFNYEIMFGNTLHHQSSLYKSHLFKDFRYQLKYPICADYELNLKMFLTKEKSTYIQTPICYFRNGGKSSDPDNSLQARDEIDSIMKTYIVDNYHVYKKRVGNHFYIVIKVILKLREYLKIVKLRSI